MVQYFIFISLFFFLSISITGCGPVIGMNQDPHFTIPNDYTENDPSKIEKKEYGNIKKIVIINMYDLGKEHTKMSQQSLKMGALESRIVQNELKKSGKFYEVLSPLEFYKKFKDTEHIDYLGAMNNDEVIEMIGRVAKKLNCDAAIFSGSEMTNKVNMFGLLANYLFAGVVHMSYTHTLWMIGGRIKEGKILYKQGQLITLTTNELLFENTPDEKTYQIISTSVTPLTNHLLAYFNR